MRPLRSGRQRGSISAEFALALPAVMAVLMLLAATVRLGVAQWQCHEAAVVAVRLVARGEAAAAQSQAAQLAPAGARIQIESGDPQLVRVTVSVRLWAGWFAGVPIEQQATALREAADAP